MAKFLDHTITFPLSYLQAVTKLMKMALPLLVLIINLHEHWWVVWAAYCCSKWRLACLSYSCPGGMNLDLNKDTSNNMKVTIYLDLKAW